MADFATTALLVASGVNGDTCVAEGWTLVISGGVKRLDLIASAALTSEVEVTTSTVDLSGPAPAGAQWGVNSLTGQAFYVDSSGNWARQPVASVDLNTTVSSQSAVSYPGSPLAAPAGADAGDVHIETYNDIIAWYVADGLGGWAVAATAPIGLTAELEVISAGAALSGVAPAGAELGVDRTSGQLYYPNLAGNWTAVPAAAELEVIRQAGDLTGVAPVGAEIGVNTLTGGMFYVNSAGNWAPVPAAAELEVVRSANDLTGAAPVGAEWGVNTTTGKQFYVDAAGNWASAPAAEVEVVRQAGALTGAAPVGSEIGVDTSTGDVYYVDAAGNWQPASAVADNIYTANGTLNGNRLVNGGGFSFALQNTSSTTIRSNGTTEVSGFNAVMSGVMSLALESNGNRSLWPTTAPAAGQVLGYQSTAGGNYQLGWVTPASNELEVVTSAGALSGAAPVGAEVGVDTSTGDLYYVDASGNWQLASAAADNIYTADGTLTGDRFVNGGGHSFSLQNASNASFRSNGTTGISGNVTYLTGNSLLGLEANGKVSLWPTTAPAAGQVLGYQSTVGGYYQLGWVTPAANELEVVTSAGALSGAAPAGAEIGVNTTTGDLYYVSGGAWQPVPSGAELEVIPSEGPLSGAAPTGAEFGFDVYTGDLFYVDTTGNWQPVPAGGDNIYTADGTLTDNRYMNGNGKLLNFSNLLDFDLLASRLVNITANVGMTITTGSQGLTIAPSGAYKKIDMKANYITMGLDGDDYLFPAGGPTTPGDVLQWAGGSSGSSKELVWGPVTGGTNIYTADGVLADNRFLQGAGKELYFMGLGRFDVSSTGDIMMASNALAQISGSDTSIQGSNSLTLYANTYGSIWPNTTAADTNKVLGIVSKDAGSGDLTLGWVDPPSGANIYTANGTITANRAVTVPAGLNLSIGVSNGGGNVILAGTQVNLNGGSITNVGGKSVRIGWSIVDGSEELRFVAGGNFWRWPKNYGSASNWVLTQGGVSQSQMVWSDPATLTSDARLKTILGDVVQAEAASAIAALRPTVYAWNSDEEQKPHHGFIAQEVAQVLPHAVSEDDTEDKALRINYMDLIATLTAAVQHLQGRVASLEAAA